MSIHDQRMASIIVIDILVGKAVVHGITDIAQHFAFDLTCDVIGEAEVNKT